MTLLRSFHLTIGPLPRNNSWRFEVPIYLKLSGIVDEVLGYPTVSNLGRCHIPFNWEINSKWNIEIVYHDNMAFTIIAIFLSDCCAKQRHRSINSISGLLIRADKTYDFRFHCLLLLEYKGEKVRWMFTAVAGKYSKLSGTNARFDFVDKCAFLEGTMTLHMHGRY